MGLFLFRRGMRAGMERGRRGKKKQIPELIIIGKEDRIK